MKADHPETGADIKVMGVRLDRQAHFAVSVAFIDAHIADAKDYLAKKAELCRLASGVATGSFGSQATAEINAADLPPRQPLSDSDRNLGQSRR